MIEIESGELGSLPEVTVGQTESSRIFELIDKLRGHQPVEFRSDLPSSCLWRVTFRGEPSFRHVNRIGMFREFLDDLLPGELETVGGELGSVVVVFGPHQAADAEFIARSNSLVEDRSKFEKVSEFLGINSLEYDGKKLSF